tara:strand:- start:3671 stop:3931 length:261 start_codon:yes stop_codon:yes gene_type:complete
MTDSEWKNILAIVKYIHEKESTLEELKKDQHLLSMLDSCSEEGIDDLWEMSANAVSQYKYPQMKHLWDAVDFFEWFKRVTLFNGGE